MIQNSIWNIIYLGTNNLYGHAMHKFLPTSGFKWIDPKEFDLNKYTRKSSKEYVLKVDLEYPTELSELNNNYPLAPRWNRNQKTNAVWLLTEVADLYSIPIRNVKKLVPNFYEKEKYVLHYKLATLFETRIKTKKIHHALEFNQSQWLKPCIEYNTHKRIEADKNKDKDGNALHKLITNALYGKSNEKHEKWNRCKTSKQEKRHANQVNTCKNVHQNQICIKS